MTKLKEIASFAIATIIFIGFVLLKYNLYVDYVDVIYSLRFIAVGIVGVVLLALAIFTTLRNI